MFCTGAWATTSTAPAHYSVKWSPPASSAERAARGFMSTHEVIDQVDQQRAEVVAMARDFAQREIAPHAAEWDARAEFPAQAVKQLGELGFMGMLIPEEYEGLGLDLLTYLMVLEEIAAADAGLAITLSIHNSIIAGTILANGTDAQRERWLKPMARGEILGAFSLSEPGSGS